ncbi:MAG: penicillin-binding protein 1C [Ignavibacteriae bacterium]|nr:penicillin-binding protein 1C [Ignavibacteriota bacterium]
MRRRAKILLFVLGVLTTAAVLSLFLPLDDARFTPSNVTSLRILDRNGIVLREVLSEQDGRGRWCALAELSPDVIDAFIAAEDSRFYSHPGVDPIALTRATLQNVRAGRIISGGSTITMQLIRNLYPSSRTVAAKLRESWYALRLERMMSKEDILQQYLNRAPFGNQLHGIDAAARGYFGKPALQLSLAEAALLAAIPNSPARNDPYKHRARLRERQLYVLARMKDEGYISEEERERAEHEPLVIVPRTAQFKAPHFTTMILQQLTPAQKSSLAEVRTTLNYPTQKSVELLVEAHVARLKKFNITNAAAVVIDNRGHSLVSLVGSKDFFDTISQGQVNGALALRQPGSTLKPFTYGLALESGMTASDLLADIPWQMADFLPENYDKKFHGPVRLRVALACSYNVPAVRTLEQFGAEALLTKLHDAGFASLIKSSAYYGVGLTLGDGEVTLLELANAYSALANSGAYFPVKTIDNPTLVAQDSARVDASSTPRQVFSPQVAYILSDILSDAQARAPAFGVNSSLALPFPCAAKTGTSKDYKDNWTVGFTPEYTVGVWVGNFDATPMRLVSGITGAAPLFRDIMLMLHQNTGASSEFIRAEGIVTERVCPRSGMLVGKDCPGELQELFVQGTEPSHTCTVHRKFRIDTRNGLLASRTTPREFVVEKTYEIFPPIFDSWADKEGIARPPVQLSASAAQHERLLAIHSPMSGDVFKIDPILRPEYQTIVVESEVATSIEDVRLWINGREEAALAPPFRYHLALAPLRKGKNSLVLKGRNGARTVQSDAVVFAVQ